MKRINFSIVTLLAVALMFVFASCTKDGVYTPKKKISKIYKTVVTEQASVKELAETWTWDGKLLSKIDYGDDVVVNFTYDKKQLTTITNGNSRLELNYDDKGKYLDNIKFYWKDVLGGTYTFTHNDKHLISGYTLEYANDDEMKAECALLVENVFRFIAPEVAHTEACEFAKIATSSHKGDNKYTVEYTYDGKNIIEQVATDGNEKATYTYTYTEYNNPFYGMLSEDMGIESLSKNAVSTCVRKVENLPDYNYSYVYKADGKVPTQVTETFTWTISMGNLSTTHTETTIYDYEYTK